MDIILLRDIVTLGDKHEVIKVKNGYGRNYLIPKGLAVIANSSNMQKLDDIIARDLAEEEAKRDEYLEMMNEISGKTLKIGVKSGTSGKIFGSINSIQVVNALKDQLNVEVARKKIALPDEIKEIGTYQATITLHPEVSGTINLELVKE